MRGARCVRRATGQNNGRWRAGPAWPPVEAEGRARGTRHTARGCG